MYEKVLPALNSKATDIAVPKSLYDLMLQLMFTASIRRHPDIISRLAIARRAVQELWEAEVANERMRHKVLSKLL